MADSRQAVTCLLELAACCIGWYGVVWALAGSPRTVQAKSRRLETTIPSPPKDPSFDGSVLEHPVPVRYTEGCEVG